MTIGNIIAILASIAAIYGVYAFVSTKLLKRPAWPLKNVNLD